MDYDSESATGGGPSSMQGLLMQNTELRRKLEEQNENYKAKLAAYQEGQSKQTEIVKKLQQKVSSHFRRTITVFNEKFAMIHFLFIRPLVIGSHRICSSWETL